MTNYQEYLLSVVLDLYEDEHIDSGTHSRLRKAIIHGDPEANWKGHPDMDKEFELIPISCIGDTRAHNALKADYRIFWDEHHVGTKYLNDLANKNINDLAKLYKVGPRTIRIIRNALDKYNIHYTL